LDGARVKIGFVFSIAFSQYSEFITLNDELALIGFVFRD